MNHASFNCSDLVTFQADDSKILLKATTVNTINQALKDEFELTFVSTGVNHNYLVRFLKAKIACVYLLVKYYF